MRWQVTILILVCLRDAATFQIFLLFMTSIITHFYLFTLKPYPSPLDQGLAVFNEYLVSIYLLTLLTLTGYNENPVREAIGWALLGILLASIGVNFGKFSIVSGHAVWTNRHRIKMKVKSIFAKVKTCGRKGSNESKAKVY